MCSIDKYHIMYIPVCLYTNIIYVQTSLKILLVLHHFVYTSIILLLYYVFTEVVEHACSITSLCLGETLPNVAKDMDIHSYREPLGVTAGICPFNFPAMIPLWVCIDSRYNII